jgi:energy-coupling factor transporter ATP-binding protein EcfA2
MEARPDSIASRCPYPGLRPFRRDETDLFFGREAQIEAMLAKLESHRFLAVVGVSGCGKSSLVQAGLLPALEAGFLSDAGPDWRMAIMHPGETPFKRLAEALSQEVALGAGARH